MYLKKKGKESDMVTETFTPEETFKLGKNLGQQAKSGQIYCLNGDLGTGKTVFSQGFSEGLGIKETVDSPTFTILKQYDDGRIPLYHFDVYRIGDISEMDEIGYEDYFYGHGVCLIEWSNLVAELLPGQIIRITIEKDLTKGFDYRKVIVEEDK